MENNFFASLWENRRWNSFSILQNEKRYNWACNKSLLSRSQLNKKRGAGWKYKITVAWIFGFKVSHSILLKHLEIINLVANGTKTRVGIGNRKLFHHCYVPYPLSTIVVYFHGLYWLHSSTLRVVTRVIDDSFLMKGGSELFKLRK